MNAVALMRTSREMLVEIVSATDALPLAWRTADRPGRDGGRGALGDLDRIAERAEGLRRRSLPACAAIILEAPSK